MGKYHVLNLGSGTGYLDMGITAGKIVSQLADFSISAYYYVEPSASLSGAGRFLWAFSALDANTQTDGPYTAYRLNAQRFATSTGGWGGETDWKKAVRQTRADGRTYSTDRQEPPENCMSTGN